MTTRMKIAATALLWAVLMSAMFLVATAHNNAQCGTATACRPPVDRG